MKAVLKDVGILAGGMPEAGELALINRFAKKELKAEEVYAFSVKLCDNEVDRDFERFPVESLERLAPMFVGKSGVLDHQWSAQGQTARIYRTEVVREKDIITGTGEAYCFLKGYAYMLRTEKNLGFIQDIEGGIKREVSVGCAVGKAVCSICGKELKGGACAHIPGREYEGKLCFRELREPTDAYEFSFVAVPAQPRAGVMKKSVKGGEGMEELEKQAEMGRRYLAGLRQDMVRLGGLAEPELAVSTLKAMAQRLEEPELLALRDHYAKQTAQRLPVGVQLPQGGEKAASARGDTAFLI